VNHVRVAARLDVNLGMRVSEFLCNLTYAGKRPSKNMSS
jgi:hypothetical protein